MDINTTEDIGICFEKSICDISSIQFNTNRRHVLQNYLDLEKDKGFVETVLSLNIDKHIGGRNTSADFVLKDRQSLSVKTNIRGFKVCPQNIGQASLKKLSENIYPFKTVQNLKEKMISHTLEILEIYLKNLFFCDKTLYVNFEKGICYLISKISEIKILKNSFTYSRDLFKWKESMSIRLEGLPFAEIQVHQNRNIIKCRFNIKNITSLIKLNVLKGLEVNEINLIRKYIFQVKKNPKSFNYIGSKLKLLDYIQETVENYTGKPLSGIESMIDCFSGSGVVANHFIENGCKKVIVNDNQYYASTISSVFTKEGIDIPKIAKIIEYLNSLEVSDPKDADFIYNNYTPKDNCERMYFTPQNGLKIDRIRQYIEQVKNQLTDKEYRFLIKVLLYAVTSVSNCAAVYGAYLKKFKSTSLKNLTLDISLLGNLSEKTGVTHSFFNKDICELLDYDSFKTVEVCYIDSPYNGRKYSSNFHLLETIALYDYPEIKGKTGLRVEEAKGSSSFCLKSTAENMFKVVLSKIKCKYIFISYSSESIISKDTMIRLLEENWENVQYREKDYQRFKSNNNNPQEKFIKEYIFCGTRH